MRVWSYYRGPDEAGTPDPLLYITDDEIIDEYWPFWLYMMGRAKHLTSKLTHENCITDWVVTHWAQEVKP